MKNYVAFILCIIMALSFCGCNDEDKNLPELPEESSSTRIPESERGEGKLIVNGIESKAHFVVYQTYAELPLVGVLEAFGYTVNWISDTEAIISDSSSSYNLNLTDKTLIKEQTTKNILPFYGNKNYKCEAIEGDIILDDVSMHDVVTKIGKSIIMAINYETLTVTINEK